MQGSTYVIVFNNGRTTWQRSYFPNIAPPLHVTTNNIRVEMRRRITVPDRDKTLRSVSTKGRVGAHYSIRISVIVILFWKREVNIDLQKGISCFEMEVHPHTKIKKKKKKIKKNKKNKKK